MFGFFLYLMDLEWQDDFLPVNECIIHMDEY